MIFSPKGSRVVGQVCKFRNSSFIFDEKLSLKAQKSKVSDELYATDKFSSHTPIDSPLDKSDVIKNISVSSD